jgi:hypothetical protein
VLQAIKTLDLVTDDGQPTATFEAIRLAPQTEYQKCLGDWLKGTYADVFAFVDPSKDDPIRIRDAFRSYQPVGQQPRMVALFQGLCVEAGLMKEPQPATSSPSGSAPRLIRRPVIQSLKRSDPKPSAPTPPTLGVPPALAGLMASLPSQEGGWTKKERDKFLSTFEAVLDFCYPVVERKPTPINEAAE